MCGECVPCSPRIESGQYCQTKQVQVTRKTAASGRRKKGSHPSEGAGENPGFLRCRLDSRLRGNDNHTNRFEHLTSTSTGFPPARERQFRGGRTESGCLDIGARCIGNRWVHLFGDPLLATRTDPTARQFGWQPVQMNVLLRERDLDALCAKRLIDCHV